MIRSMTGYGRAQELRNGRDITVEFRSVNHRYFEFSARVPRAYGYLEEKLKGLAQGSASRGRWRWLSSSRRWTAPTPRWR